jgi:hypothetical protein
MVYLGIVLAMHFLLRVSEYAAADKGNEEHCFRTNEVFLKAMGESALIVSFELSSRDVLLIIEEVHFRLGSSKTNHKGGGITMSISRGGGPFEVRLIEDIVWWCRWAGIKSGDTFFRRYNAAGNGKSLSRTMVSTEVRRLGVSVGLPKEGLSSHSLRVSGACLLHRNGVAVEDIDRIGRWKPGSTTAMAYRAAVSITSGSLNYGTNTSVLNEVECTIKDVHIVKSTRDVRMK